MPEFNLPFKKHNRRHDSRNKVFIFTIIIFSLLAALFIMLHQWILYPDHWFDLSQILHHEDFSLDAVFFALGLSTAWLILRKGMRN